MYRNLIFFQISIFSLSTCTNYVRYGGTHEKGSVAVLVLQQLCLLGIRSLSVTWSINKGVPWNISTVTIRWLPNNDYSKGFKWNLPTVTRRLPWANRIARLNTPIKYFQEKYSRDILSKEIIQWNILMKFPIKYPNGISQQTNERFQTSDVDSPRSKQYCEVILGGKQ